MGASGVVVPGIDADTALMMHMDGANDGVIFADSSVTSNKGNATVVGTNCVTKTAFKKWGTASAYNAGVNGHGLTYADHADFEFMGDDTQDYNIGIQLKLLAHTGTEIFLERYDAVGGISYFQLAHIHGTGVRLYVKKDSVLVFTISGGEIEDTDWHHILLAKVCSAGPTVEWGLYVDGTQVAYASDATENTFSGVLGIMANIVGNSAVNGYGDELRIQKSNLFGAAPNVGLTDTIDVPTKAYSA